MSEKAIPKTIEIKYGIREIRFVSFELTPAVEKFKKPIPHNQFQFQFQLQTQIREESKTFEVMLKTIILHKKNEKINIELGHIESLSSFFIENYDEVVVKKDGILKVPDTLFPVVAGIAIATIRGMLIMKLKDTTIESAIIPVINPFQMFPIANTSPKE